MYPASMLPDACHLQNVGVESGLCDAVTEGDLMQSWRTGGHHYAVQLVFLDMFFNLLLPGVGAGIPVSHRDYYAGEFFRKQSYLLGVHRPCYIKSAVADKYAYS